MSQQEALDRQVLGRVVTNGHSRPVLHGWDLTDKERAEFDYIDWAAVERGEADPEFVRYRGETYDLGDCDGYDASGLPVDHPLRRWARWRSDSYFSAVCFRWPDPEDDAVVVGTFLC